MRTRERLYHVGDSVIELATGYRYQIINFYVMASDPNQEPCYELREATDRPGPIARWQGSQAELMASFRSLRGEAEHSVRFPVLPTYTPPASPVNTTGSVAIRQIVEIEDEIYVLDTQGGLWEVTAGFFNNTRRGPVRLRRREVLIDTKEEAK